MADTSAVLPTISATDLKDPTLTALNNVLQFLGSKLVYLEGGAGPINIKADITAPHFFGTDITVPTNPQQLLTLAAGNALYKSSSVEVTSISSGGGGGGGSTQTAPVTLVFDGDSLTFGFPVEATSESLSYPGQVQSQLETNSNNIGVNGATSASVIATHLTNAVKLYKAGILNIYTLIIGVNDLLLQPNSGAMAAALAALKVNVASIVTSMQTTGFKVIVGTISPTAYGGIVDPVDFQAARINYNAWVIANSAGADAIVDSGDDPVISNPLNLIYYQADLLHMTAVGYSIVSKNVAAAIQQLSKSQFAFQPVNASGTRLLGGFPQPANIKVSESLSINDFGASTTASADINTAAILAAIAAAQAQGKSVCFPEASYLVHKFNVMPFGSGQGLRLWSDCNSPSSFGPGTILLCDGGGTGWLKACINVAPPNSGNTGPILTQPVYGMQIEGLYVGYPSGSPSISGHWLVTNFNFEVKNCGVVAPASGQWVSGIVTWQCGLNGRIINYTANTCSAGIALNGNSGDPLTAFSADIYVENPGVQNCTSSGIAGVYAENCRIVGGYYINCAVGFFGNGPTNIVEGGFFSGNTKDVDMLTAAAPWGPTVTPNYQQFFKNNFTSSVNIKGSLSSILCANTFGTGSSLTIDSGCTATALLQHNSVPATFTDAGALTYLGSVGISTASPVGGLGIQGQFVYDTTSSTLYICTVSSDTSATWTAIAGGGGGGSTLNLSFRTSTSTPITITHTDFMVVSLLAAGTGVFDLPKASTVPGQLFSCSNQNPGNGLMAVTPFSGDTIQGSASAVNVSKFGNDIFQSDGVSNWTLVTFSVVVLPGTGIGVSITGNNVTISNSGVLSLAAGTGINVSASVGAITVTNIGVTSLAAGAGIGLSGATGAVTITNQGLVSSATNLKATFGFNQMSGGTLTMSAASLGLTSISGVVATLISGVPAEFIGLAFTSSSVTFFSSNTGSNSFISWIAIGAR